VLCVAASHRGGHAVSKTASDNDENYGLPCVVQLTQRAHPVARHGSLLCRRYSTKAVSRRCVVLHFEYVWRWCMNNLRY